MENITYTDYNDIYDIIKQENESLAFSSVKAYADSLRKILKDLNDNSSALLDYDRVYNNIMEANTLTSTKKNKINTIIVFLKAMKQDDELINKYFTLFIDLSKQISEQNDKMEKSERELENWVSIDELKERIEELKLNVPRLIKTYYDIVQYQRYIAALIQVHTGLRNEISDCEIYDYNDYKDLETDNNVNYLIVRDRVKEAKLIIQNYKTRKCYGVIEVSFDEYDTKEIKKYLRESNNYKKNHNINTNWLIYDKHGLKLTRNDYSKFLQRIFNIDDKKISSTMIRKIILSNDFNAKSLKNKARAMGHSVSTQMKYYVKE